MTTARTTHNIQPTPEARARLVAYHNEIVSRRKEGGLADVSQYASRWCEQAARLAVVLHAGLHGATAHQHPLELETADRAVTLAKWFADQQLGLLAKVRRQVAVKLEDDVMQLIDDRIHGKRLEPEERELGRCIDYVTPRTLVRARITTTADPAKALLTRMEAEGLLIGEDVSPKRGGPTTRIFRRVTNPVPE